MVRILNAMSTTMTMIAIAFGVSLVATLAVLLASWAGWMLSPYLQFTRFETTGLWLLAGSVVTLTAAVLFAASMVFGTQRAQQELLERLADADDWDDNDVDDEIEEVAKQILVMQAPSKPAPRRSRSKARRSR